MNDQEIEREVIGAIQRLSRRNIMLVAQQIEEIETKGKADPRVSVMLTVEALAKHTDTKDKLEEYDKRFIEMAKQIKSLKLVCDVFAESMD